ncbi:MAG: rhodanese-like domain-containing protein [Ignavibacteriaceae bacterium]
MIQRLNPKEAKDILDNNKSVRLIDVREEWENHKARIKNSELMPLSRFVQMSKSLNKEQIIIVYCHHGVRSLQVCNYLETLGFSNLINLEGGIDAWSKKIDNSVPVY